MATLNIGDKIYGGSGPLVEGYNCKAFRNLTDKDIELKGGYSTVANGYASAIVCPAGCGLIEYSDGSPRDFAGWLVVSLDDKRLYAGALHADLLGPERNQWKAVWN